MLPDYFSPAAIVATLCLMSSVSAAVSVDDSVNPPRSSSTTSRGAFEPNTVVGNVVKSCGTHISVCGAEDEDNVIYVPRSTETETNEIHTTSIKRLKPTTTTVTEISVSTIIKETKGHCRKTVTAAGPPVKVTVDVVIVSIQEVQDVDTVVETVTSITTASVVEQCFLEKHTILGDVSSRRSGSPSEATPYLSSTQTASPAGFTADFDQPSDDSTPNDMEGGLHRYGMYEQGSDE